MTLTCPNCRCYGDEFVFFLDFFGECRCPICRARFEIDIEEEEDDFDPTCLEYSR